MGRSPECPACRAPVYPAESFMASDRTPFHKSCVKCRNCSKTLTSNTLNEHNQHLYCRPCYENLLNPKVVSAANHHLPLNFLHFRNFIPATTEASSLQRIYKGRPRRRKETERRPRGRRESEDARSAIGDLTLTILSRFLTSFSTKSV